MIRLIGRAGEKWINKSINKISKREVGQRKEIQLLHSGTYTNGGVKKSHSTWDDNISNPESL